MIRWQTDYRGYIDAYKDDIHVGFLAPHLTLGKYHWRPASGQSYVFILTRDLEEAKRIVELRIELGEP